MKRFLLTISIAFAAGVAVGIFADAFSCGRACPRRVSEEDELHSRGRGGLRCVSKEDEKPLDAVETTASTEDTASKVEVVTDTSPAPSPEISAVHAARQARRAAVREAKEGNRRDFLANMNPELLTDAQRKTHELFVEALNERDKAAAEIRRLRAAGQDVPSEIQSRLADAQSVLRADHDAEYRILREAAARAAGLEGSAVRQLIEDLESIDEVLVK